MNVMILLAVVILIRIALEVYERRPQKDEQFMDLNAMGLCQTNGDAQVQADCYGIHVSTAGCFAVLADGIGRENTGRVAAQIVIHEMFQMFAQYKSISNAAYFLKRCFLASNEVVRRTLDGRQGGASTAAVLLKNRELSYATAGDVKILIFRNGELIPLNEGHTVELMAKEAYKKGQITRQTALAALKEVRLWNYIGVDEFGRVDLYDVPVKLQEQDLVVMLTKGIYQTLSWVTIEQILENTATTIREKADEIVMAADQADVLDRENGSVVVLSGSRW